MIDRDTVIALAKKSGAIFDGSNWQLTCDFEHNELLAFAQAVAQKAVEGADNRAADIVREKAMKMEREAQEAEGEGDSDSATSLRATAWVLSSCETAIRNRGIGGGE